MLVEKPDNHDFSGIDTEEECVGKFVKPDPAIRSGDHVECLRERGEFFHRRLEFRENAIRQLGTLLGIPPDCFLNFSQARVDESRVHFTNLVRMAAIASSASTDPISPFL